MSDRIYDWLLRLYPPRFREAYGDEALQLFRDRARDETGFLTSIHLWLDLLADLVISVPREYRYAHRALLSTSVQRLDGMPLFSVLRDESPRVGAMFFGGVVSLVLLGAVLLGVSQVGNYAAREAGGFRQPATNPATLSSDDAASSDLQSNSLPPGQSSSPQAQSSPEPQSASATTSAGSADLKLDASARHRVIDGAITNLEEYYIYPEVAQKMANALLAHEKSGDDNAATDGEAFASLLTRQMRDVSHDGHLILSYSAAKVPEGPSGPTAEELARFRRDMERTNCTLEKVEILPRNIGYLKFNEFPPPSLCRQNMETAMNRLRGVDAIIFDLRDNHGGSPDMVALIATYLFDHPTHLNDMYNRRENSTHEYWTLPPIPGNKLASKPAYVLTSHSTFSGAEEFSYDLKMLKRATLVGETTGGGAHPASGHRIDDHFRIRVPFARPINPVSKTNWEGTGVEPDVKVKAADALATAEKLAHRKLQRK